MHSKQGTLTRPKTTWLGTAATTNNEQGRRGYNRGSKASGQMPVPHSNSMACRALRLRLVSGPAVLRVVETLLLDFSRHAQEAPHLESEEHDAGEGADPEDLNDERDDLGAEEAAIAVAREDTCVVLLAELVAAPH